MARKIGLKQVREVDSTSPPEDGDVLIYSAVAKKYVPGSQGSASIALLNKIVTFRTDAQVSVMRSSGDVMYFR